jgi:hypothetical protein
MDAVLTDGLILPALLLAIAAFVVPRLLAGGLPEGVAALMLNAFLSTLILIALSGVFFWGLYLFQGLQIAQLADQGLAANIVTFGRLGLMSGLIWAPIMVLSVAGLPRRWVHVTW